MGEANIVKTLENNADYWKNLYLEERKINEQMQTELSYYKKLYFESNDWLKW